MAGLRSGLQLQAALTGDRCSLAKMIVNERQRMTEHYDAERFLPGTERGFLALRRLGPSRVREVSRAFKSAPMCCGRTI